VAVPPLRRHDDRHLSDGRVRGIPCVIKGGPALRGKRFGQFSSVRREKHDKKLGGRRRNKRGMKGGVSAPRVLCASIRRSDNRSFVSYTLKLGKITCLLSLV
jgi:hypothetical protein